MVHVRSIGRYYKRWSLKRSVGGEAEDTVVVDMVDDEWICAQEKTICGIGERTMQMV